MQARKQGWIPVALVVSSAATTAWPLCEEPSEMTRRANAQRNDVLAHERKGKDVLKIRKLGACTTVVRSPYAFYCRALARDPKCVIWKIAPGKKKRMTIL